MAEELYSKERKMEEQEPLSEADRPNLPFIPLTDAYSFFNREEEYNMSEACWKWSEGFNRPGLWRSFVFALTEDKLSMDPWYALKLLEENCDALERVYIPYCIGTRDQEQIEMWIKQFNILMDILTRKSKLKLVEFHHLGYLFSIVDYPTYKDVCRVIGNFLVSQNKLEQVMFSQCFFDYHDSIDLLKKLVENSNRSIKNLLLPAFVKFGPHVEREQILPTLVGLPELKTLDIDYSLVLGRAANPSDVVETLKNCKKGLNLRILLFVNNFASSFKNLKSSDWTDLKELHPHLQVEVFTESRAYQQNSFLIVKGMPVTVLFFNFSEKSPFYRTEEFFNHLRMCKINEHLLDFQVSLEKTIPDLAADFLPFLNACPRLNKIGMQAVYPVPGLNVLLESFAKTQPESLKKFSLNITEVMDDDNETMLEELTSNFVEVLKLEVNLDLENIKLSEFFV